MTSIGPPNSSSIAVIDPAGRAVADAASNVIGIPAATSGGERWAWALPGDASGLQRYLPNHPPAEMCNFGMDYGMAIPYGAGIASGALSIFTHLAVPAAADGDWVKGTVAVWGRALFAQLSGGLLGTDYELRWTATDSQGNIWQRTALILVAITS